MLIPYKDPAKAVSRISLKPSSYRMGHAIVMGAGPAGLLAARVLWKHFDRVTILEREWAAPTTLLPNVSVVNGAVVTRFAADWEYSRLTGVFVRSHGPENPEDLLYADLVVDATGQRSKTPRWLNAMGYRPPPQSAAATSGPRRLRRRLNMDDA